MASRRNPGVIFFQKMDFIAADDLEIAVSSFEKQYY